MSSLLGKTKKIKKIKKTLKGFCGQPYSHFSYVANDETQDNVIQETEFCKFWYYIASAHTLLSDNLTKLKHMYLHTECSKFVINFSVNILMCFVSLGVCTQNHCTVQCVQRCTKKLHWCTDMHAKDNRHASR